ncbi:MAG: cytochrome P450 [Stackebrandtia sp.]
MTRSRPFDPPDEYARLRAEQPIGKVSLPTGKTAWAVASHAYVRQLFADSRLSSRREHPGFPAVMELSDELRQVLVPSILGLDAPEHTAIRRSVITEFTVRRIQALRPAIQRIVDAHVDALLAGERPADLVAALALPVPSLVVCELLGVPYEDHNFFQERSQATLDLTLSAASRIAAVHDLNDFLDVLVSRAESDPGDDLLGRLIVKNRAAGVYDHQETTDLARLLLVAGHETTANMISLGITALLDNPGQLDRLRDDASLWPQAVEELLRYFTIADFVPHRVALKDIEIGGVTIAAGDGVLLLTAAADRDPEAFADPDTLDVDRGARNHVAFGYGVHQCLGQNLARLELEIVYRTLFERIPDLKIVDHDELSFKDESMIYGMHRLPATW